MSFTQGAPTQPLSILASNVFLTGSSTAGNAFTVQQLGAGNVASFQTSTSATSLIINPSGQVGIGKTNPGYALDVTGDLNFTGTFRQNGTPYVGSQWTGTTSLYFVGNVGIGTNVPSCALSFGATTNNKILCLWDGNTSDPVSTGYSFYGFGVNSNYLRFQVPGSGTTPSDGFYWYSANTERMRIQAGTGNVGIGYNSPQSIVHVQVGDVVPTASGNMATGMIISQASGGPAMCLGARTTGGNYTWIHSAYTNNSGVAAPLVLQPIGGNVGIGNTTPQTLLWLPSTSTSTGLGIYNADVAMILGNTAGSTNSNTGSIQVKAGGSSTGIGTGNYNLTLNPDGGSVGVGVPTGTAFQSLFYVRSSTVTGAVSAPTGTVMTIDKSDGGILSFRQSSDNGTYSGLSFLDNNIGGFMLFRNYTGASSQYGDALHISGYNGVFIYGQTTSSVDPSQQTIIMSCTYKQNGTSGITNTAAVGIGTTSPNAALNVWGSGPYSGLTANPQPGQLIINTTNGSERLILGSWYTGGTGSICSIQASDYYNAVDHGQGLVLNPLGGSVGVGTATLNYTLTVNGTIGASGDITALYSDERLKTKTGTLTGALDKVSSLDTFTYRNNELAQSFGFKDDYQRVGVSAQQVQKVLPEAVRPAPFDAENQSGQNYLTVQYEKLVPLLIEALKEERHLRCQLEERVAALESASDLAGKATASSV